MPNDYKKKNKEVIEKANNVIKKIQSKCKHDFEIIGSYSVIVVECKKCGFIGGA